MGYLEERRRRELAAKMLAFHLYFLEELEDSAAENPHPAWCLAAWNLWTLWTLCTLW
ncbi:hypothetical protein LEMLEM_LOCUS18992, partial [Lemmus lemmus]